MTERILVGLELRGNWAKVVSKIATYNETSIFMAGNGGGRIRALPNTPLQIH